MNTVMTAEYPQQELQATLLFVDDESNILASLRRLFRPLGYRILIAESGAQGLAIFDSETIDLVISDMRMPEMDGAQFLEQVRLKSPDTIRILLTGYADISSTIDAINKGQVYRYIAKPWEDNDICLTVRHALEQKMLAREKERLEALTLKQNEELKDLNANLEEKVKARTEEVRQTMGFLEVAHEKLKKSFLTSIRVFANLMELREGEMTGHSRRVADLARKLALKMGMSEVEAQEVMVAALLHDIGKIGLPDKLLHKPFTMLDEEERTAVVKHPVVGQTALMALEQLHGAAKLIRSHHERFDGLGFPDHLAGLAIPLGARVLAVANEYDAVQLGHVMSKRLNAQDALVFIREGRGKRYDPQVVDAFIAIMGGDGEGAAKGGEIVLPVGDLKSGMVLARDLITRDGMLLLARDYVLDEPLVDQLKSYERTEGHTMTVHVKVRG
ncbi:MAG TPA: HD domain-containing phosphohydrolase [Methylophilaceae bacterium]|nr:HD domain-containing phosphohydrolase [Methylophilaceae bacterium]